MIKLVSYLFLISLSLVTPLFISAQEATFEPLGFITDSPDAFSQAEGVSEDGSVVVGVSYSMLDGIPVSQAFRWENGVMEGIGVLPTTIQTPWSYARSISADGSTVVGYSMSDDSFGSGWEAMKWTEDEGMEALGDFTASKFWSESTDVSGDGSVVVGRSYMTGQGFRWENGVMESLTTGDINFLEAWGVSDDGSVIVGSAIIEEEQQAAVWREGEGILGLGSPPSGTSYALGVSADGSAIVGFISESSGDSAYRWTEDDGMLDLGSLGGIFTHATAVSNDGSVVVGFAQVSGSGDWNAFYWSEQEGMQNLKEMLENSYDLDLTGWVLNIANGVSGDGRTIVGAGINPDGQNEAWRVTLPAPLSITDFSLAAVKVYPNPSNDIINIQAEGTIENIKIYDVSGKVVKIPFYEMNNKIDISGLSTGIYFVDITIEGHTQTLRVIKE